jgi:CheY-like chemotaxis protein
MALTILIADDDTTSCLILRKMLVAQGHSCDVVYDGFQAVQASCGKHYDLVFVDLYMPVLSGIHAAITIRSLRSMNPVIIGIASSVNNEEISLCKDAGMKGILLKPYDRESIAHLIRGSIPQASQALPTQENSPRDASSEVHVLANRSWSPQANSCRAAIQRATEGSGPVRKLQSRSTSIRSSSAHSPSCAWTPIMTATFPPRRDMLSTPSARGARLESGIN